MVINSNAPPPYQTTRQMYRSLLFSVYMPSFFMSMCQGSVLLILPLFALELGADVGVTALVFSLRGLGNMMADVPAGFATAKFGDRTVMISGITLMIITALVGSQANSPLALSMAAFAFGAAVATWLLARLTHLSQVVASHQRGKAISTMAGLQRFGNLIGPVLSGFIAYKYGYDTVFLCIAGVALIALSFVIGSIKTNNKGQTENGPGIIKIVPHILTNHYKVFISAGLSIFFLTILRATRHLLIPLWGISIGLDSASIGLVVGASAAVDMLMFPLAGYLMDNLGRRYAAISCQWVMAMGLFLIPFSSDFLSLMLVAMLAGFGNGLGSGINMTLGADFAPAQERGEFLGVWRLVSDTGSFVGPVLMGYIASTIALASAFTATAGLGFVGGLIMLFFVKETLNPNPQHHEES